MFCLIACYICYNYVIIIYHFVRKTTGYSDDDFRKEKKN